MTQQVDRRQRGSYGIDAPYAAAVLVFLVILEFALAILSGKLWAFAAFVFVLTIAAFYFYATLRGKFVVWAELLDQLGAKWSLVALAVLLLIASGLWLTGWRPNFDRSIELSDRFGKVENGSAYDRAAVDLSDAKKVVLPHDAVVRRVGEPGKVQLFMKKTLGFGGHPSEPMSIRDARKNMGCAVKTDRDELLLATFGEWDSHIEGGTQMKLVAYVPEGIEVEQRKGLSGEDSAGREWHGQYLTKPKDAKGGYWYGPASPAEGWTAVPDVPDPDRTAR